jgi:hypothetical protein
MRIIIAGGRDFNNYELLKKKVSELIDGWRDFPDFKNPEIISGHAQGADSLGERFAKEFGYDLRVMTADWDKHGKSAGMIRNKEMATYAKQDPDYCALIAFWDGKSKGTKNMIEIGRTMLNDVFIAKYK